MDLQQAGRAKVPEIGRASLTLTGYVRDYMAERRADGSYGPKSQRVVAPRLATLVRSFGRRPIAQFTEVAIRRWLDDLEHLTPNSRASYVASVRQFTAWLVDKAVIHADPMRSIPRPRRTRSVPRAQTSDAVAAILAACADDRERAIVWLMVGLGLRRMEVAGLRWEHYDERDRLVIVANAKNGRERLLPVTDEVAAALTRIRDRSGPVIRSKRDNASPVTVEHVGLLVGKVMRRAGVKKANYDGVSGHALRHTCASDVLDNCGDLRVVQEVLGHENLATTAIYLRRASASQMRTAMGGRRYGDSPAA